jgi:hypothetical protein
LSAYFTSEKHGALLSDKYQAIDKYIKFLYASTGCRRCPWEAAGRQNRRTALQNVGPVSGEKIQTVDL